VYFFKVLGKKIGTRMPCIWGEQSKYPIHNLFFRGAHAFYKAHTHTNNYIPRSPPLVFAAWAVLYIQRTTGVCVSVHFETPHIYNARSFYRVPLDSRELELMTSSWDSDILPQHQQWSHALSVLFLAIS